GDATAIPPPDAPGQESGGACRIRLTPPVRQQSFPLEAEQFIVRDHPRRMLAATAGLLQCPYAAQAAVFAAGEGFASGQPGTLLRRVELFDRLPLDQLIQHGLDAAQAFFDWVHRSSSSRQMR